MATNDLTLATRELFERSLKAQIFMRTPVLEQLVNRNLITFKGGKYIERLVDKDEMTELGQAYTANEALTDEKKDMLQKPRFTWKYYQMPLRYDVDEDIQNIGGGDDVALLDLAAFLAKKGQRGVRLGLQKMLYNVNPMTGAGSETGVADSSKFFQSFLSALDHDVTSYGTITRALASSSTSYWMAADPEGTAKSVSSSSQNTAYNISISNFRKWCIPIYEYMESAEDLYAVMCPTLWNKLRAEVESHGTVDIDKEAVKYGVRKFWLDGHQIVADPFLEKGYGTSGTTENWVFILNLSDWELRISTKRNFKMTDFEWDGKNANGHDYWLARILLAGNFMCWKPNGSIWVQNVS